MKLHPRIRKTIKWGGLVLTVVLVVVWVWSAWWAVEWRHKRLFASLARGRVGVAVYRAEGFRNRWISDGATLNRTSGLNWSPYLCCDSSICALALPIWMIAPVTATLTGVAWHLDTVARRRARLNQCPKCRYNRTGLAASAPCPECGTPPTLPASS